MGYHKIYNFLEECAKEQFSLSAQEIKERRKWFNLFHDDIADNFNNGREYEYDSVSFIRVLINKSVPFGMDEDVSVESDYWQYLPCRWKVENNKIKSARIMYKI